MAAYLCFFFFRIVFLLFSLLCAAINFDVILCTADFYIVLLLITMFHNRRGMHV